MTTSSATTVAEYLDELDPERAAVVKAAHALVRKHMPKGYTESMGFGMICWSIPLEAYPDTYNKQPLCYVALASQKRHVAIYLTCTYIDPVQDKALRTAYAAAGKKLDMGKSCLRFRTMDDLVPEAVGNAIASAPPERFIEIYESVKGKTG